MSWPNPPRIRTGGFPLDKAIHFLLYAVEAFLLDRAIGWKGRPGFAWSRTLAIVGTMTLWGAIDEAHQAWIPGRTMDSGDLVADAAGAVAGAVGAGLRSRRRDGARSTATS